MQRKVFTHSNDIKNKTLLCRMFQLMLQESVNYVIISLTIVRHQLSYFNKIFANVKNQHASHIYFFKPLKYLLANRRKQPGLKLVLRHYAICAVARTFIGNCG